MRVLFLTPWYPDEQNANHGIFVRHQAAALSKHHEVLVISAKIDYTHFGFSSMKVRTSSFDTVAETRVTVKQSLPVFNQLNYFLRVLWITFRIGRQFRPDIIHTNIGYPGAFWGWVTARLLRVPCVLTEHTRLANNFRSGIHKFMTLFAMSRMKALIAVSNWHAREIKAATGIQPVVIHNIVDFRKYPGVIDRPTGIFQMGFLGGLSTPVKGLDILLQACTRLRQEFFLHIGGGGKLLEEYKTLAQTLGVANKCHFYGSIPHEEVPDFMEKLNVFVSASRWETFGIAMVEALACGIPVVAADSGGSSDFITPENGLIVSRTVEGLVDGINNAMTEYKKYDPVIIRNSVIEKFTDNRFLERINPVYEEAVASPDTRQ